MPNLKPEERKVKTGKTAASVVLIANASKFVVVKLPFLEGVSQSVSQTMKQNLAFQRIVEMLKSSIPFKFNNR